jgi:hypothetical protein
MRVKSIACWFTALLRKKSGLEWEGLLRIPGPREEKVYRACYSVFVSFIPKNISASRTFLKSIAIIFIYFHF